MVYVLRITLGQRGLVVVWIDAQIALITHGANRLVPVERKERA